MSRILITDAFPSPPASLADDMLVVTPNARLARQLGVRPVSLRNHAADLLKRNGRSIATPLIAASALRQAVSNEVRGSDGLNAAGSFREMVSSALRSGVDLDALAASSNERPAMLGRVARRYVKLLEGRQMVDAEAVLHDAIRLGLVSPQRVCIHGYFRARGLPARPEELIYIERLAADGSIFYLPCGESSLFAANNEWRDRLLRGGWQESSDKPINIQVNQAAAVFAGLEIQPSKSKVLALSFPTIEAEVRGTLAGAKAAVVNGASLSEIAIVCRQPDQYAELLLSTALEYRVQLVFEHRVSLRATEAGRFVSLLLETVTPQNSDESQAGAGFPFEGTARLLKHQAGPDIVHEVWRDVRRRHSSGLNQWREVFGEMHGLEVPTEQPMHAWATWLRRLLKNWSVRSRLGSSATEVTAIDQLLGGIDELARGSGLSGVTFDGFVADVYSILDDVKTPFSTSRAGIAVTEPNTIVGCRFKTIFVIGMCEGGNPAVESDDTLIDHFERNRLAAQGICFQDVLEVPRWEAMSFYFTLLAAQECVLSYAQFAAGKERLASPYFDRIGARPVAARPEHLSCVRDVRAAYLTKPDFTADDSVFDFAKHQLTVEADRVESGQIDEHNGILNIPVSIEGRRFSVSQLTRLGQCPFKWFAADLLRLRAPDEAETEFAANRRGSLYHKALEIGVRENLNASDIRAAILADLDDIFERAEAELEFSFESIPNWELRRAELLQSLRDLIASDAFLPPDVRILETEVDFDLPWKGVRLKGTIDRIDETPKGLAAVDYKSGTSRSLIKDESGRLKIDIQLPIYSQVALANIKPGESVTSGRYISISTCETSEEEEADLERIAIGLKEIFKNGRFAVEPDTDGTACRYCDHAVVCRLDVRRD